MEQNYYYIYHHYGGAAGFLILQSSNLGHLGFLGYNLQVHAVLAGVGEQSHPGL